MASRCLESRGVGDVLRSREDVYGGGTLYGITGKMYMKGGPVVDLMVVQIGLSVWAGTATPPPVGCPPELYELMGNFSFV